MRVLLVDDERELVSALAERLNFRGIEAEFAICGSDAEEMVRSKEYDLAILDMKMPRLCGFDLMKVLKNIRPEMNIIFMTGHASEEEFKAGSDAAVDFLLKPVSFERLYEKIMAIKKG